MKPEIIAWTDDGALRILDQTLLPRETVHLVIEDVDSLVEAIRSLRVRGAPLIGVTAAMGLAAAARRLERCGELDTGTKALVWLEGAARAVAGARPTAVNLRWAVDRVLRHAATELDGASNARLSEVLAGEAQVIWDEDAAMCAAIAASGAELIPAGSTVMTHCNTGRLATGGIGTALGIIYSAYEAGRVDRVLARETRPLDQGSRLTAWELHASGVPVTVLADSAAASVFRSGGVQIVVVGADRIAANGDVANKIGTYDLAVLARTHDVPFYVAAPRTTFDLTLASGDAIPIEERPSNELPTVDGVDVYNPAFDVTPAEFVTAIITDVGVACPPSRETIADLFENRK